MASAGCQGLFAIVVKRGVEGLGFHRVQNFGDSLHETFNVWEQASAHSRPIGVILVNASNHDLPFGHFLSEGFSIQITQVDKDKTGLRKARVSDRWRELPR